VEGQILDPEKSHSVEAGVKGRSFRSRLTWDASVFQMDFSNLVVATIRNGQPAIENAGTERFRGGELELDYAVRDDFHWELGYGYHDSRFRDYAQNFGGAITQLAGRRLEMVPLNLFSTGMVFTQPGGFHADVVVNYAGERFLNRRNTAIAKAYATWSGGIGYRIAKGDLRLDGRNLNNARPPIAESELGDAQYYRLPARSWDLSYRMSF
jgi:outer membrane receptor protein involved in Fe transport